MYLHFSWGKSNHSLIHDSTGLIEAGNIYWCLFGSGRGLCIFWGAHGSPVDGSFV
jgi:hypothetical protein